ncbi:hypothetical protein FRC03_000473 [Tulasnella sp. 419]|nr:hypothetical protein FRC03_000473 [Tulasnella sp. 419]
MSNISGLFIQIPDNIVVESSLAGALVPAEETSFNQNAQVSTPVSSTSDRAINDNNQLTSAGVSTSTPHTSQPSDHVTSVTPKSAPPAPAIQQSHEPNTIPQTSTTAATNPPSYETVKPSVASHSHPEVDLPSASAHSLPPPSETSSRETEDQANHVTAAQPQEKQSSLNPKPPPPIPPDTNTSSANPTMSDSAVDGPPSNTAGKPSQLNDWAAIEATLQANFDAEVEKLRKQVREACIRHVGDEAALHQVSNITQAQYNWIKSRHDLAKRQLFTAMSQKADKSIKPIPAVPSHSSSPYATVHKTGHNNTTSQSTPISQAAPTAGSSSHPATSQSQPSSSKSTSHSALKSIPSTSIISLSPRGAPTHVSNSQHVDTSIQTAVVGNQQQPKYPSRGLAEDILLALAPFSRKRKRGTEVTESEKSKGKRKTGGSEFASAEANQIVASLALNDAPRSLPVAGKLDKGKGKAVDLEMAMEASNVREMAKALLSDPQPSSILVERGPAVDQTTKGLVEVLDQPSESMEVDPVMNPSATIASNNVPQGEIDSEKTKTPDIVEVSPIRNSSKPPSIGLVTEVASVPPSLQPSSRPSSPSLAADPSGTPKSEKQKTVQEPQTLTAVTPIEPTLEVRGTPETHPTPLRATPEVQQVSSATATSEVHEALSPLMARYSKMPLFIPDSPPEDVGVVPSSTGEVTPNRSPEPEIRVTDSSEEVIVKLDQQFSNLSTEQELSGADAGSKMEDAEAEISEVEGIGRNPYTADGLWYPNRKLKVYVEIPVYASSRAKKQKQKALDNLERIVDQLPAEDLAGYEHRARILRCRWDRCPVRLDCAYKLRYHTEQKHLCSKTEHKCVWRGCQNAEFNNWDELYEHVTEQHLDRLNYCPYEDCEKRCDTIDLLQRHIWRFHVDEDDSTIVSQRRRIAQPTRIVPPDLKPLNELKSVPSYLVDWMYFKVRPAKISKYRRKTLEPWVRQRISEVGASRHSMTPMSPSKRLVSSGYHARESGHDSSNVTDVFGFLRAEVDEDDGGRRRYPALPRRRTLKVSGNSQQENPAASASQGGVTLASGGILPSLTSQGHQGEGGSRSIAETDKMNLGPVYGASYHADHLSSREKFATGGEGTSGEVD